MQIKNLEGVSLEIVLECLLDAFSNYFVKMPDNLEYWRRRFQAARVDWALSFGVFQGSKLVAFIINGIDLNNGLLTAFNTGTGVIADYRGKALVDQLYGFALPFFKERGVEQCLLEVIQENERAIRVYERIGFEVDRDLRCFTAELKTLDHSIKVRKINYENAQQNIGPSSALYSWDNNPTAVKIAGETYHCMAVEEGGKAIGYFLINPENGYLAQVESPTQNWSALFAGIAQVRDLIKINNIDIRRTELLSFFESYGFENTINQYEMRFKLK